MKALTTILMLHYYKDSRTDGALQRQRERERKRRAAERTERSRRARKERKETERRGGMEEGEEGLCLPRRVCFILGLSMVTVAVLLPLTETWLHPSVHTLFLKHTHPHTHTHSQFLSLLPRPVTPHPLRASLSPAHCLAPGHCLRLISHTRIHTLAST